MFTLRLKIMELFLPDKCHAKACDSVNRNITLIDKNLYVYNVKLTDVDIEVLSGLLPTFGLAWFPYDVKTGELFPGIEKILKSATICGKSSCRSERITRGYFAESVIIKLFS